MEKAKIHKTGRPKVEKTSEYLVDLKIKQRAYQRKYYLKLKDGKLGKKSSLKFAERRKKSLTKRLGKEAMTILEFENYMKEPAAVTEEKKKTKAVEEKLKKAEADKA